MHYYTSSAHYNNINIIIITTMIGLEEASNGNHTDQEIRSLAAAFLLRGTYVLTYLFTHNLIYCNYSFVTSFFFLFFYLFCGKMIFFEDKRTVCINVCVCACVHACVRACVCLRDHARNVNFKERT